MYDHRLVCLCKKSLKSKRERRERERMEAGTMEVKELIRKEMEDWEDEEVSRA